MAHLQTDGARVFSQWHNEGMTSHLKRLRDPSQLAKVMIDIASGEVEDREPHRQIKGRMPGPPPSDGSAAKRAPVPSQKNRRREIA